MALSKKKVKKAQQKLLHAVIFWYAEDVSAGADDTLAEAVTEYVSLFDEDELPEQDLPEEEKGGAPETVEDELSESLDAAVEAIKRTLQVFWQHAPSLTIVNNS
jgi:histidinol dehydrogenase